MLDWGWWKEKRFPSLEKQNFKIKSFSKLGCENKDVITDQAEILKQGLNFYSKLYHSDSTEQDQFDVFRPNSVDNKLSEDDNLFCFFCDLLSLYAYGIKYK